MRGNQLLATKCFIPNILERRHLIQAVVSQPQGYSAKNWLPLMLRPKLLGKADVFYPFYYFLTSY
jgi:hypothetical protein